MAIGAILAGSNGGGRRLGTGRFPPFRSRRARVASAISAPHSAWVTRTERGPSLCPQLAGGFLKKTCSILLPTKFGAATTDPSGNSKILCDFSNFVS